MTEERGTSEKHDGNRVCPIMSSGYFQSCIEEDCMAWDADNKRCFMIEVWE